MAWDNHLDADFRLAICFIICRGMAAPAIPEFQTIPVSTLHTRVGIAVAEPAGASRKSYPPDLVGRRYLNILRGKSEM